MNLHTEAYCTSNPIGESAISKLNRKINSVSNRVSNITPYEESKQAYIGDTEISFNKIKNGVIISNCYISDGTEVPTTLEILENEIIVRFEPLNDVATVKISIQ